MEIGKEKRRFEEKKIDRIEKKKKKVEETLNNIKIYIFITFYKNIQ